MGIQRGGNFDDVDNRAYITGTLSISTSQTELKVGGSRLDGRQTLIIQNTGSSTIYIGPTGVTTSTGIPLGKGQFLSMPIGDGIAIYALTASGTNTVVVQEIG
jgi:hypothetical protein